MSGERLAGLLARRLREEGIGPDAAVSVAELRRQLLPYPYCRERLELASKAEYDLAMLELLGDAGLIEVDDEDLEDAVERETSAPEPGLGFLEEFAAADVRPGPDLAEAMRRGGVVDDGRPADIGPTGGERPVRLVDGEEPAAGGDEGAAAEGGSPSGGPTGAGEMASARPGGSCRACGGDLPARDDLRFCPWCGADQQAATCSECGAELAPDWSYCPECGEPTGG